MNIRSLVKSVSQDDGITVTVEDSLKQAILDEGYHPDYGVRRLKDILNSLLHTPLVNKRKELILADAFASGEAMSLKAAFDTAQKQTVLT